MIALLRGSRMGLAAMATLVAVSARAQPAALRATDWPALLSSDSALAIDPDVPRPPFAQLGPYITLVDPSAPAEPHIAGFAVLDSILYGDVDADGIEEAVILLESGGTAGVVGLLVYHADDPQPRLAATLSGYKLGARIENGALVVLQPTYAGFEPNCCPSAELETSYVLDGDALTGVAQQEQPLEAAQALTVQAFYSALNQHALVDAYAFLSEGFQRAQPFDTWSTGYRDAQGVRVDDLTQTSNGVAVRLTAVDRSAAGQEVIRRFTGTWSLVWGSAVHRWLLDSADIVEVR